MRILLASSSSGSQGGGEIFLLYLGRALAARGHQVALWASAHERMDALAGQFSAFGEVLRSSVYQNTYDRRLRSVTELFDRKSPSRIAREWREWKPDALLVNKQNLEDGLSLVLAANELAMPTLGIIHITQSARYLKAKGAWVRDAVSRRALNQFRAPWVAVSDRRRESLQSFLPEKPVFSIYNGVETVDPSRLPELRREKRRALGLADENFLCVAVGRMVSQKQPLLALDWLQAFLRAEPKARLCWVGDGELAQAWDERARELGLSERVIRPGWRDDVPAWLAAADAYWHPAQYEGLPLALLEAMLAGLPCVIRPDLCEEATVLAADNLFLADDAGKWLRAFANPEERSRRGIMARSCAEAHFTAEKMAMAYEALLLQARL